MGISTRDAETWRGYLSRISDLVSDMKEARRDAVLPEDELNEALHELNRFRDYLTWKSGWAEQPEWYGRG
jgi:hypothetical protein